MKRTGRIGALVLLLLTAASTWAQQVADTCYVFRFLPGNDMFYVPFRHNEAELKRLVTNIDSYREELTDSLMYLNVTGYAVSSGNGNNRRIAFLRNSRIKSELIRKAGVTEAMFATDRYHSAAYGPDSLRDVVVVTLPASVSKVRMLLGQEAADKITACRQPREEEKTTVAEQASPAQRQEQPQRETTTPPTASQPEQVCRGEETQDVPARCDGYHRFGLQANLLRWATLTADLGIEYRPIPRFAILAGGTFANWGWKHNTRRYRLWEVSPEIRTYLGRKQGGFVGAMFHVGEFNYKLNSTGKKGNLIGGGITGGYRLSLNRHLALDLHASFGCTRAEYDEYKRIGEVNVRNNKDGKLTDNYWGVNRLGVTLVWMPGKCLKKEGK